MTSAAGFRAGAGRVSIEPPLGLPMLGFVRRWQPAVGYGLPLEVTALVLERGDTRAVLVGVDTALIAAPEGAIGYLPTAEAIAEGGFESGYAYRAFGHAANFAPDCERLLVETGLRLAASLFPERSPPALGGWHATGHVPPPPPAPRHERPPVDTRG